MADNHNHNHRRELSTINPTSTTSTFSKSSYFNRSITIHASANPFSIKSFVSPPSPAPDLHRNVSAKKWYNSFEGKVRHLKTLFETPKSITSSSKNDENKIQEDKHNHNLYHHPAYARLRPVKSFSSDYKDTWPILDVSDVRLPGTEDRVVIYFTSLRGVRRTHDDCYAARMIFRGFKVFVDERDVSMDNAYKKELKDLLGEKNGSVSLPQIFIKGRHVGGVELVRQWNETGELRKILQSLPIKDRRFVCDMCGDIRFLPCSDCSGSRKVFDEVEEVMKRCLECNENGLIRCPECCC